MCVYGSEQAGDVSELLSAKGKATPVRSACGSILSSPLSSHSPVGCGGHRVGFELIFMKEFKLLKFGDVCESVLVLSIDGVGGSKSVLGILVCVELLWVFNCDVVEINFLYVCDLGEGRSCLLSEGATYFLLFW
eukprot:GHVR01111004.1.p1 GENE.GHVR01111004.1~~GHVR01111004.1.p1  ORF type:complete len:134 (+),score=29.31 GHVR01111004.1:761-1162(+)